MKTKNLLLILILMILFLSTVFAKTPEIGFFEVEGVDIYYEYIKNENSPLNFILLHGFGASTGSFRDILELLSIYGSVLAFDRPAFGLTERVLDFDSNDEKNMNPYTPDFQNIIITSMINHFFKGPEIVFIGHSAGGTVSLNYALTFPEKIKGIILISPSIRNTGDSTSAGVLFSKFKGQSLTPFLKNFLQQQLENIMKEAWFDFSKADRNTLEEYKKPLMIDGWEKALIDFSLSQKPHDIEKRISEINVPVLIVHGIQDKIIPLAYNYEIYSELPDYWLVTFDKCGHIAHEELKEEFLDIVGTYIQNRLF